MGISVESIIRFRDAMQAIPPHAVVVWQRGPYASKWLTPTAYRLWQMKRTVKLRAVQRWNKKRRRRR